MKENKKTESGISDKVFFVICTLIVVLGICFSSFVLYQKKYFTHFFVNGQSMYPTLNLHAKDPNGKEYGEIYQSLQTGTNDIDYGIFDSHEVAINSLKRFDIVICKYFNSDDYDKIKRLIVLPGETFYIERKPGTDTNGNLYIQNKDSNEFELVEQPIDKKFINAGVYPVEYSKPYTLKENEYFVMGDNRAHSNDSRVNGPVTYNNIIGRVVAIVAHCSIKKEGGNLYAVDINFNCLEFL